MKENALISLSKEFAVETIKLSEKLKERGRASVLISQLLRSATSIGANIHEANYAASKADFVNKLQIALKECYETDYWLDIFKSAGVITEREYQNSFLKCSKLRRMLIASINTAKNKENTFL